MGSSLARWRALSSRQKRQLVLLTLALPATGALIRVLGFKRTANVCDRIAGRRPVRKPTADEINAAEDLATLAGIAGRRGPVSASCLRQALVVRAWLRRRGLDAQLKIGVKKNGDAMDAHAWVELAGIPLAQPHLTHTPFPPADLGT
jgi:hypothetical protein